VEEVEHALDYDPEHVADPAGIWMELVHPKKHH
jgi:hypothetical protein